MIGKNESAIAGTELLIHFRVSHTSKNLLLLVGCVMGWVLPSSEITGHFFQIITPILLVFLACCVVAAWNYALNDFCDSGGDCWHPEKCGRVTAGGVLIQQWPNLVASGVVLLSGTASLVWFGGLGAQVAVVLGLFVLSGAIYNIPPVRLKRFPFVDVVVEALNFPIRLALGWYAVAPEGRLPPLSAMLAIWAFGGVLLTGKRAAELARIGDESTARAYRPALLHYTLERALVVSSLYGMVMLFGAGVLFAVYPPLHNLIFLLPFVLAMTGVYLWKLADGGLATRELEPEKLLRRPSVLLSSLALGILAILLVAIPADLTKWLGFFGH